MTSTKTKTKTPKWRPGLVVEPGLSPVAAAVSLAMRLLTESGAPTWSDLTSPEDSTYRDKALAKVSLTAEQGALLDAHADVLTWIVKMAGPDGKAVATKIAICPSCEQYTIVAGAVPSACKITSACRTGAEAADKDGKVAFKPVPVKPATRQKDPEDPLNTPDLDVALAPVQVPEQVEPEREAPEVLDDGMIRPTVFVFGDVIEDDEDDEPAPAKPAPAPVVVEPKPAPAPAAPEPTESWDVPVPSYVEEPPSYVYDDVPPPPDDYYGGYEPEPEYIEPDPAPVVEPAPAIPVDANGFIGLLPGEEYSDF